MSQNSESWTNGPNSSHRPVRFIWPLLPCVHSSLLTPICMDQIWRTCNSWILKFKIWHNSARALPFLLVFIAVPIFVSISIYFYLPIYLSIYLFPLFPPSLPLSRCPSGLEGEKRSVSHSNCLNAPWNTPSVIPQHSRVMEKERKTQVVLGGGVTVVELECKRISQCQIPIRSTDMSKQLKDRLRDPTL